MFMKKSELVNSIELILKSHFGASFEPNDNIVIKFTNDDMDDLIEVWVEDHRTKRLYYFGKYNISKNKFIDERKCA